MKSLFAFLLIVLLAGCSLTEKQSDNIATICGKDEAAAKTLDTACETGLISAPDCANMKDALAAGGSICFAIGQFVK